VRLAFVVAAFCLAVSRPRVASAESYLNDEYRFRVEIPAGMKACIAPVPGSNHGVRILLGNGDCTPDDLDQDTIYVYDSYNVVFEARGTHDLARGECRGAVVMRHDAAVRGHSFDACDIPDKDGGREFNYVTLRTDKVTSTDQWLAMDVTITYQDRGRLAAYRGIAERVIHSLVFW
jgi:hypothetical protein